MPNLIPFKLNLFSHLSPCDHNVSIGYGGKFFEKIVIVKRLFFTLSDYLFY